MTQSIFKLGAILAIALITLVAYAPGWTGGYVFDDIPNIVENDALAMESLSPGELYRASFSSDAGRLHRPVAMFTFAVERHFFGLDAMPMKITNTVIHALNALLLATLFLLIVRQLERRQLQRTGQGLSLIPGLPLFALAVAAAWALAPINLTGVLFVVQRMEALATLFMLAGLIGYVLGRQRIAHGDEFRGWLILLGSLGAGGALAVLSKESGVMLPVFALLLEWLLFGFGERGSTTRRRLISLFGLIVILPAVVGGWSVLPNDPSLPNRPFTLEERLWTQVHALWFYLANIVIPSPGSLALYHDAFPLARSWKEPWTTLPLLLGLLGLIAGAFLVARRLPLVTLGILWFFIPHLLVSTVIPLELVFEHRNHMASAGPLLAVFALVLQARSGDSLRNARMALVIGLIAVYGFLTFLRANEWSDPYRQAYFEATRHQDSPRAGYELAHRLLAPGLETGDPLFGVAMSQLQDATTHPNAGLLPHYRLIVEHARRDLPVDPQWQQQMAAYIRENVLTPQDINALHGLLTLKMDGDLSAQQVDLEHLIDLAVQTQSRMTLQAVQANYLLNIPGDFEQGESLLLEMALHSPDNPQAWANLAQFQISTGQYGHAEHSLRRLDEVDRFNRMEDTARDLRDLLDQHRHAEQSGPGAPRLIEVQP
ncbi:tetratricopeptide repeat protein [Thioalkalivibrio sp. ALE19]|uniref:tetratricopeptide repeat protein n=1 Tax=Thioalkalivibrio sp. ALE19 TaxID=1266909 RepID=UPI00040B8573|nr:tetratricopeptide repeat protein [Thioalkalivibrio sp. ALE19]